MKYIAILFVLHYGSAIQPFSPVGPTASTLPPVQCLDLCPTRGPHFTGHIKHPDPRYFVSCHEGVTVGCLLCDPAGKLHFNENCQECRYPGDEDTNVCLTVTGQPTTKPDVVCLAEHNEYADFFCQNLAKFPGYDSSYENKTGNYAYEIFTRDLSGNYILVGDIKSLFIACNNGAAGYCMFCPAGLEWKVLQSGGQLKKDCGYCDWPAKR